MPSPTFISGTDGAVTMPDGAGGKAFKWDMKVSQRTKDVSVFGGGRVSQWRGGMLDYSGSIGVLFQQGTGALAPGLTDGDGVGATGAFKADGSAVTLTAMTGCTYAGTAVMSDGNIASEMGDPAIAGAWSFKLSGVVTETWVTT